MMDLMFLSSLNIISKSVTDALYAISTISAQYQKAEETRMGLLGRLNFKLLASKKGYPKKNCLTYTKLPVVETTKTDLAWKKFHDET